MPFILSNMTDFPNKMLMLKWPLKINKDIRPDSRHVEQPNKVTLPLSSIHQPLVVASHYEYCRETSIYANT